MIESATDAVNLRARELLKMQLLQLHQNTDRMFSALLLSEWIVGIILSIWVSPLSWAGRSSSLHINVWIATVLGALVVIPPCIVASKYPGRFFTRCLIACAQMLYSSLLIHLTGGRIETHFHIFGSLAFLSFYKDWRVLIPATVVVVADHVWRGVNFPQSVYGVAGIEPWRWLEHAWWILFEDSFLIMMCRRSLKERFSSCQKQANIELIKMDIEGLVERRTSELKKAKQWASMEYAILNTLSKSQTWHESVHEVIGLIASTLGADRGRIWGSFWTFSEDRQTLICAETVYYPIEMESSFKSLDGEFQTKCTVELTGRVWQEKRARSINRLDETISVKTDLAVENGFSSAVAFPVRNDDCTFGIFEFFSELSLDWDLEALESLGQQIGLYVSRKEAEYDCLRLANIVRESSDAIITLGADDQIVNWNQGAESLFVFKKDEACHRHLGELFAKEGLELQKLVHASFAEGSRVEAYETSLKSKEAQTIDISLFAMPWFEDDGAYAGCSLTMHNITERKNAERRVAEFYSIVSHELRTPLTSIRGALGLIEGGLVEANSDDAKELINVALSSSDRLIRLINDMLDLKKIECGKMQLQRSKINVDEFVASCLASISGMSEEADVKLSYKTPIGLQMFADRDKATQILTNLLSNAIKFSPRGTEVKVITELAENNRLRFRVIDRGSGISESDQEKLFGKFQQLDSSDSRSYGGTGLGLAISKALVEEHGGKIGVRSAPEQGSEFFFDLPLYCAAGGGKQSKILIVESNPKQAFKLKEHLEKLAYDVSTVRTLRAARKLLQDSLPDLVILDLNLPDGAGLELVSFLKADERSKHIPILALAAEESEEMEASIVLLDWQQSPSPPEHAVSLPAPIMKAGCCKVLIVDDDPHIRRVLKMQFSALGLQCVEADSGSKALDMVYAEAPDLMVLDVMMPEIDGFGVVEVLRKNRLHMNMPVMIYSCRDLSGDEKQHLSLGLTRYLLKGEVSPLELTNALDELLSSVFAKKVMLESDSTSASMEEKRPRLAV
ncbi:MAG: response regulator [Candidatus Obscuribacterales bacterium]|nr:response regulator [Candidatus Obscuribacterales bacterium]